ncbi:hypothetical protein [Dasania marina]|uniref:hypothetical protein n=1 Tax=Dasania marina TaxID=471499 RepID=UPI0004B306DF|nr:hypothetical protein [Dasania marina]
MTIIVAGKLMLKPGAGNAFIEKSREALEAFRNAGPDKSSFALVASFHVNEYEINT